MHDWSVIIPTFNGIRFVGAALASVRRQTVAPAEVLVVDAGSSDGTAEYLEALAREWPALRVIRPGRRLTAPQARNVGLAQVQTPFVASLDQDDLMARDRLEKQGKALKADVSLGCVGGRMDSINDAGVVLGREILAPSTPGFVWPITNAQLRWAVLRFCPALSSSQSFRVDLLREAGGFDEAHPLIDDYSLLARMVDHGRALCLAEVVGGYRRHGKMTSRERRRRQFREGQAFQWRLVHRRLGSHVELDAVTAFIRPDIGWSPSVLQRGKELAGELLADALAQPGLNASDREWIQRDFDRRLKFYDKPEVESTLASATASSL